jgi:hypothetical protein
VLVGLLVTVLLDVVGVVDELGKIDVPSPPQLTRVRTTKADNSDTFLNMFHPPKMYRNVSMMVDYEMVF